DRSFDPKMNPAVRVEASRLRRRLEFYYLTLGRDDPVLIELPRGGYVPVFQTHADVLHLGDDLARVRAGDKATASLVGPREPGPAVAVLPFGGLGQTECVFCDGITIEIITALSRFRELHVIGRSTAFGHRGERDMARLRDELGVDFVLTGSVRREGDRVRVNAELVHAPDGSVRWAQAYERE